MFTGIVEEVGSIRNIATSNKCGVISINADKVLNSTSIGDSIAVNGICLTVTDIDSHGFVADVMPETMSRTTIGSLRRFDEVNLERAMPVDGRFGGHIVSGHIDGIVKVASKRQVDNAFVMSFEASRLILRYVVEKGSVALNGVSLTVVDATDSSFSVSIISHTMNSTNLRCLSVGSKVNIECDIVAKYIERMLFFDQDSNAEKIANDLDVVAGRKRKSSNLSEGISLQFLAENGFDV